MPTKCGKKMIDYDAQPLTTPAIGPNSVIATALIASKETRENNGLMEDAFPFAVQRYIYVAENKDDARKAAEQVLIHARMASNMRQSEPAMEGADLKIVPFDKEPDIDAILDRTIIGSTEEVTERIVSEALEFGITHLSVFMQIASIPFAKTLRSLREFL